MSTTEAPAPAPATQPASVPGVLPYRKASGTPVEEHEHRDLAQMRHALAFAKTAEHNAVAHATHALNSFSTSVAGMFAAQVDHVESLGKRLEAHAAIHDQALREIVEAHISATEHFTRQLAELEARTIRGRWRALMTWCRAVLTECGVLAAPVQESAAPEEPTP